MLGPPSRLLSQSKHHLSGVFKMEFKMDKLGCCCIASMVHQTWRWAVDVGLE
jgi:hypothetical protein